jgi:glycosyltransferase involved in cell wall biosynthesis
MTTASEGRSLLILPGRKSRAAGIDARRIAAAGLAEGLRRAAGDVVFVDADGPHDPRAVERASVLAADAASAGRSTVRRIPAGLRPGVGDAAAVRSDLRMAQTLRDVSPSGITSVVQFHHRFQRAGGRYARRHGIPLAMRVEALEVQEEAAWGVRRPGYGGAVQRLGEFDLLKRADLVVPVSSQLDAALARGGIPAARRLVVSNGVDLDAFRPGDADAELRRGIGGVGRYVVGWIGGFRPFHGLETVETFVAALRARRPDAVLCLVGAGPLRADLERRAAASDGGLVVTGPAEHEDIPRWIRSFDACVILGGGGSFHYSPMKALEYLACGRPVVAPLAGDLDRDLEDGRDCRLVPPGDVRALARAVADIAEDPDLAARLGTQGRRTVERTASWQGRARAILDGLASVEPAVLTGGRRA